KRVPHMRKDHSIPRDKKRWWSHVVERMTETSARGHSKKIGRNDPCPCGSGQKFKRCCGSGEAQRRNTRFWLGVLDFALPVLNLLGFLGGLTNIGSGGSASTGSGGRGFRGLGGKTGGGGASGSW